MVTEEQSKENLLNKMKDLKDLKSENEQLKKEKDLWFSEYQRILGKFNNLKNAIKSIVLIVDDNG